jgi:hypothetical protein
LTKPFNDDTLKAVISQALFFDRKTHKAGSTANRAEAVAH